MIKKKKLKSISSLKKKAWKVFSQYIRRRNENLDGNVMCVTCDKWGHWKTMHAGHFIHGHSKPSFFEENNVHVQCVKCNHFLSGNLLEYRDFMAKEYGEEAIELLRGLSKAIWKPTRDELEGIIERYKNALRLRE